MCAVEYVGKKEFKSLHFNEKSSQQKSTQGILVKSYCSKWSPDVFCRACSTTFLPCFSCFYPRYKNTVGCWGKKIVWVCMFEWNKVVFNINLPKIYTQYLGEKLWFKVMTWSSPQSLLMTTSRCVVVQITRWRQNYLLITSAVEKISTIPRLSAAVKKTMLLWYILFLPSAVITSQVGLWFYTNLFKLVHRTRSAKSETNLTPSPVLFPLKCSCSSV